jgi:hypothetical protein
MISNSISIKSCITLLVVSFLTANCFANRDVPREMVNGIEMTLPSNFYSIFDIADKSSNDYTVAAHRLTLDLLQIAESSEKNGNYLQSFRMYRLTNYLFPHRGDVKEKYDRITNKIVSYLNDHSSCNETFESLSRELKASRPQQFDQISSKKCEDIIETVSDISPVVLDQANQESNRDIKRSLVVRERFKEISFKKELTPNDKKILKRDLLKGYLGSIELVSIGLEEREDGLKVQFELNQKNSILNLQGVKNTWETLTHETFNENKLLKENPLRVTIKFFRKDAVKTFNGRLIINDLTFFDIWLKSINFFNYPGYPTKEIALQNDPHSFAISAQGFKVNLAQTHDLYFQFNMFSFQGLSDSMTKNLKKVIITID